MRRRRSGDDASFRAAIGGAAFVLALATAVAGHAQERQRAVGDFLVVIDKDPLTLGENVSASAVAAGNLFGLRCLEGKISLGLRAAGGAPLSAGEDVGVEIRSDAPTLRVVGNALNERDIEAPIGGAQLEALSGARRLDIALTTAAGRQTMSLAVNGLDKAVARVRLACPF